MDPTELVYVIATDDDLPLSLQLTCSDGTLQPHILPESSPGSHHCAITVYDEQGNDIAGDLTIEEFEYIVDENGEVFHPTNATPNSLPPFNYFPSVNSANGTKLLPSDDVTVGTDLETCSPDSSHTNLYKMQHNCPEHDKSESETISLEASRSSEDMRSIHSCMNHVTDDGAFQISAVLVDTETNHNIHAASLLSEKNVCVNSRVSSSNLQTGQRSVPSSPVSLCHDVSETRVDMTSRLDSEVTSDVLAGLENAEKPSPANTDVTVTHSTPNVSVLDITTCDMVSSSPLHLSQQPCVSFSVNSSSTVSLRECEDNRFCKSNSGHVSTSCVLSASNPSINKSSVAVVSEFTHSELVANSASCFCRSQSNNPATDFAANCNSDSFERHVASSCLCQPAATFDSSEHSASSHNPAAEFSSSGTEQHSAEKVSSVGEMDITASNPPDSAVTVCALSDHCNAHHHDVLSSGADKAERTNMETELAEVRPNYGISDMLSHCNLDCLPPTSDCDYNAADEFIQERNDVIVTPRSDIANTSGLDSGNRAYNLRSKVDTVGSSKTCPVLKPSDDGVSQLVRYEVQKFADAECQVRSEYAEKYRYNGCRRDLLQATSSCSDNIQELRQKLCALHQTRRQLRKWLNKKPPCSITDLDSLSDIDCKRLRLEAMEQELAIRELSLRHREKQVDLRLRSIEQDERVLSVRQQLLARYCPSSPQQENPEILPRGQLQLATQLQSVDHKFDILEGDCEIAFKRPTQQYDAHLLPTKKVLYTFTYRDVYKYIHIHIYIHIYTYI